MKEIAAAELTQAVGGRLLWGEGEILIGYISLDPREMEGGDLFVPIIGENVDAHDFICQALGNGASTVFTSRHHSSENVQETVKAQSGDDSARRERALAAAWVQVEDTRKALQGFGAYCRAGRTLPLVGITGSVGKTTTKEMIAAALSARFCVYKTSGNSNSQVGVPIAIAEILRETQTGVIELSMNEPGKMTRTARVAQVNCAMMTNIGVTHIEQLGSQQNISEEKLHIQDNMAVDDLLVLNGDNGLLGDVVPGNGRRKILYGLSEGCHYRGGDLHLEQGYPVFTAVHGNERVAVHLRVTGSYMVSNALAVLAVAGTYGVPMKAAAEKLEEFEGYKGKQQIFTLDRVTVIDDSYNANSVSMKTGLEVFCSVAGEGRKIAVLADVKELGADAPRLHREIGAYTAVHPVDQVVPLGELAAEIGDELAALAPGILQISLRELGEVKHWLDKHLEPKDCVLFKGFNSTKLSLAVKHLKEQTALNKIQGNSFGTEQL